MCNSEHMAFSKAASCAGRVGAGSGVLIMANYSRGWAKRAASQGSSLANICSSNILLERFTTCFYLRAGRGGPSVPGLGLHTGAVPAVPIHPGPPSICSTQEKKYIYVIKQNLASIYD